MGLRKLFIAFLILFAFKSQAQVLQYPTVYGYGYKRLGADTLFFLPSDTMSVPAWGLSKSMVARVGTSLYYWNGTKWANLTSAGGDTTKVPYTGATQNVNLGQYGLKTEYVEFDTTTRAVTDRTLTWSNADGTLSLGMTNGGSITQRIGLEQFARVKNVDATQINRGDVVYLFGASGDRASVKKADNRQDATSSKTLGVAVENIAVNDVGFVGTFGVVEKLNLGSFTAGDVLYLDSIPGQLTKTKPVAPYHMVFVGIVERANNGNGLLFVSVQNGYELEELHNVKITSPVNRSILVYDSTKSLWVDSTASAIGIGTVTSVATGTGLSGGTITTSGTISADTLVLSTRAWRQKGIDSVANLPKVTSVATNTSTGITGGTITSTGTIAADTTILSTRAWRQKGIDSVASLPKVTSVATNTNTGITGGTITSTGTISADTTILSTRAWRQKGIDSVSNLPKVTSVATNNGTGITGGTITSTGTISADTIILSTRAWRQKGIDSVANLPKVTSVATNTGTGITGGTITSTGTISADTTILSTRAWRQKGIDSIQANITSGLAGKLNISDTAAMLSPYLRSSVASATYVPQSRTITINGTTQDLSANRTYTISAVDSVWRVLGKDSIFWRRTGTTYAIKDSVNAGTVTSVATNNGTGITGGTITSTGTISADTTILSTRAWRQKGIDSVASLPKVTSVATNTGTGITGGTITSTGTISADTTLLSTRAWRQKGVDSVVSVLGSRVSGTTNYVSKFTASGTIGNSQIFDNGTSVGVNTATPSSSFRLDVVGDARATNITASSTFNGQDYLYAGALRVHGTGATGTVSLLTNSNTRLHITNGGNVIINNGTTDAGYKLDVNGTARVSGLLTLGNNLQMPWASSKISFPFSTGASYEFGISFDGNRTMNIFGKSAGNDDAIIFSTGASSTEKMRLVSNGSFGIGTSSPAYKLDVTGKIRGTDSAFLATSSGNVGIGNVAPAYKLDVTGDIRSTTSAYFATTSGAVGIGTASPNASAALQVSSTTKGFLPPVMTGAQAEAISTPAAGLLVYANNGNGTTITSTGWWGYNGTTWVKLN